MAQMRSLPIRHLPMHLIAGGATEQPETEDEALSGVLPAGLSSVEIENVSAPGAVVDGSALDIGQTVRFIAPPLSQLGAIAFILTGVGLIRITTVRFVALL